MKKSMLNILLAVGLVTVASTTPGGCVTFNHTGNYGMGLATSAPVSGTTTINGLWLKLNLATYAGQDVVLSFWMKDADNIEEFFSSVNLGPDLTIQQGDSTVLDATSVGATTYLWSPGGFNTEAITVHEAGTYTVTVTFPGGCTGTDEITVDILSANNEAESGLNLALFPNPATAAATLRLQLAAQTDLSADLFAADGRLALPVCAGEFLAGEHVVPFEWGDRLPAGVYFLKIATSAGTTARRLVIAAQ